MEQIPSSEISRLAALASYEILDTPRESDFDDIADLASRICETPIAVVNLIADGRQFFKAEVGLGVRETPLDTSFCAKAILEEDFLVVPDATKDSRFDCNPLVTGDPGLRFYAGALLKTDDGHAIGTVCVLDTKPHVLTELQEQTLRVLARQVMRQLELRQVLQAKIRAEDHQNVLNGELAHRIKNTLALVQAIAAQTLRRSAGKDAFEAFERRIAALSRAHDVLLHNAFLATSMQTVMAAIIALHGDGGRIRLSGPEVELGPKATLSLSMLLHELATNAAKHGAMASESGRVDVDWQIGHPAAIPTLTLTWRESGGPTISTATTNGFGSKLIRLGLMGNRRCELNFDAAGLTARFIAPLSELAAADERMIETSDIR